uniref:Uncharacterized protein n=1 Tax=Meloidogyne enterolobii TaxID=390850 RepID=A0A6V7VH33_MELEN|nr:unnamed protein product [Meloidogyne enterolobii]
MLSLIDFGPFLALFFVAVSLSGSVSLLFCCKSKKKSATKSQIQKQALVDSRKSKENIPLKEGPAPGEKPAAAKGRQQKQLKTPPQPAKGAAIGGGGAAAIRTAALFTPPPKAPVADPKKTTTKHPATPPKPAAPKPSDKSKKDVRAGVAVPDDDTARIEDVSDSWRQVKKQAYKMPEEMTRRRLDDPDYQTWRGLGNIFDASKRTTGDMGDGSLAKDPRSDSKSRLDTKSNLSSKSSNAANSKMDEEKQAKSEGDNKKATTSQSKSSSKDNVHNSQSTVRVTMTSETSVNEENQKDNTKSEHDDNTKSEN